MHTQTPPPPHAGLNPDDHPAAHPWDDADDDGLADGCLTSRRQRRRTARRQQGYGTWLLRSGVAAAVLLAGWWMVGEDWYSSYKQYELRAQLAEEFSAGAAADIPLLGFEDLTDPIEDDPRIGEHEQPSTASVVSLPSEDTDEADADRPDGDHARPIGRIRIPSIDVDWAIGDDVEVPDLKAGPGWMPETAPLGSPGNTVLSGHRTTYGAPFNRVGELDEGDRIVISVPGRPDAVYEVRHLFIVAPDEVGVIEPTPGARLTLTTCHPIGSARERLIVQAEQVEGPAAEAAVSPDSWARYDGTILRHGAD